MKRYLYYLLGMNILVLGITCNTLSDLGVGAFSTLPYAVSFLTFLTFGQANIVFYLIFVCAPPALSSWTSFSNDSLSINSSYGIDFIFGFLVDLYQYIIPTINLNLYTQILVLLIGNTCCAIGVYFMIKGNLIMTPVDGLVLSISEVFHRPYSLCKNIFDIRMILATIIICLICHSSIYGVGIGTVFSAFYIGRVISVLENFKFKTYKKCY